LRVRVEVRDSGKLGTSKKAAAFLIDPSHVYNGCALLQKRNRELQTTIKFPSHHLSTAYHQSC
jgi:hypothetical protein